MSRTIFLTVDVPILHEKCIALKVCPVAKTLQKKKNDIQDCTQNDSSSIAGMLNPATWMRKRTEDGNETGDDDAENKPEEKEMETKTGWDSTASSQSDTGTKRKMSKVVKPKKRSHKCVQLCPLYVSWRHNSVNF